MIWLASFPRSGNTFFRNVLHEVYGIKSSTYHKDPHRRLDENYNKYQVVKTHLLPHELDYKPGETKSVYIIRDGRDSLVSIAHHRKDIVVPGSDFYNNLIDAILSKNGSFFGGWSENVRQWTEMADIIIRFEDLIKDPVKEIEKLRAIIDLPQPDLEKIPTFKSLKFGKPAYGGGNKRFDSSLAQRHFRKGKVGSHKEEMPPELEELFWRKHKLMMEQWGYLKKADREKLIYKEYNVLIEVSKLFTADNDGVKRYLVELLEHMIPLIEMMPNWKVDFFYQTSIKSIQELKAEMFAENVSSFNVLDGLAKKLVEKEIANEQKIEETQQSLH